MNNPLAFPNEGFNGWGEPFRGMTLRDYFAAKAMQAMVSSWIIKDDYPQTDSIVVEHAYAMADAMLKAREA